MHNKNSVNNIVISLYEEKKKYIYIYIYYTNHNTTAT